MNRRIFLSSTALLPNALAQSAQKITHVDVQSTGAPLKSSVVKASSLVPEGDSPGAKARVNFNGPTKQLAAVATGSVTLEPGARPHPPHQHPEEELMVIGSGTGEIVVEGVVTKVGPGDMMYTEANVLHGITNTGKTTMVFYFTKMMAKNA